MSTKQKNLVWHNARHLVGFVSYEDIEKILNLTHRIDLTPEDASIIVGNVWDIAVKDDREGVSTTMKTHKAQELKKILQDYE